MGKGNEKKRPREPEAVAEAAPRATTFGREDDGGDTIQNSDGHPPPAKKARIESNKSLFVRSLPPSATNESLADFVSQFYPIKHAVVVLDPKSKTCRGYGFVTLADADDATAALERLPREPFEGRRLRLDVAEPRRRDAVKAAKAAAAGTDVLAGEVDARKRKREEALAEARRPAKLIVRNLPWSIKTPAQLGALFAKFGKIKFADLPQSKGKLSGFGFVTFRRRRHAEKAVEAVTGTVVDGRTLAVDWAVDKGTWEKHKEEEASEDEEDPAEEEGLKKTGKKQKKASSASSAEDGKKLNQEDADLANFMKNYMENMEDEEESDEEAAAEDGEEENEQGNEKSGKDDDEESEEDGDASAVESEDNEDKPPRQTDNTATIFVRNLPFTTTDEQLKEHFVQFGPIRYARVVMNRATDRSAGTGFVCFFNIDDFKECLRGAPRHRPPVTGSKSILQDETVDQDGRYTLDGRILQVAQAVSKDEASRLASQAPSHKNQDKDKRRLYLLAEGAIPKNSPLYNLLPPSEIQMREASAKQRKKQIESNPSLHLSLTRLALRNIPRGLGSKELKALARQAVVGFAEDVKAGRRQPLSREEVARGGPLDREAERRRKQKGQGIVKQAKVVFETRDGSKAAGAEGDAGGRSRGYGFVEYVSHRRALMGLRWLNGHAVKNEATGKMQRLIVEFAIENANVVQRRRATEEGARTRAKSGGGPGIKESEARDDGPGKAKAKVGRKGKDKRGKGGKEEKSSDKSATATSGKKGASEATADKADAKVAVQTKIIARKRQMRKQKAKGRAK